MIGGYEDDQISDGTERNARRVLEEAGGAKEDCLREIEEAPTVDAVPVVYCKDCKHRTEFGNREHPRQHGVLPTVYPYDFCSYGVAKKVADDEKS